jgi:hypothetical protein
MPGYRVSGKNSKGSTVTRTYWAIDEAEALELANQEGITKAKAIFMPATEAQLEALRKYNNQIPENCCQLTASDIIQRSMDGCPAASAELRKFATERGWRGSTYIGESGILHALDSIASSDDAVYIFVAAVNAYLSNEKLSVSSLFDKDSKLEIIAKTLSENSKYLSSILKQYPISDCLRFSFAESSEGGRRLSKQTQVYSATHELLAPNLGTKKTTSGGKPAPHSGSGKQSRSATKSEPSGCAGLLVIALITPSAFALTWFLVVQRFTIT